MINVFSKKSTLILLVLLFTFVHPAIAEQFVPFNYSINGSGMSNTLNDGEVVFAIPLKSTDELQRGDVVICHYPGRGNTAFVKRLLGLPGDTVEMRDQHLYVNGKLIDDPVKMGSQPNYRFGEYKLKDDEYFVLGDNRGNSNDSHAIGPIPRSMIIAHVRQVIWPLNAIRPVTNEFNAHE